MNDTPAPAALPRILLVEDDPTSRAFLAAAAAATPARVDEADGVAAALALAASTRHDLWLVDANLPDGSGAELLRQLRADHGGAAAIAHTASTEPATAEALRAAGFDEVLVKPLPAATVQAAIRSRLGGAHSLSPARPVWDDAAAAAALNGNMAHVQTLRSLFADDLPNTQARVQAAAAHGDAAAMQAELHKLRASCGFVGAGRLGDAVAALQAGPADPARVAAFEAAALETVAAWKRRPVG